MLRAFLRRGLDREFLRRPAVLRTFSSRNDNNEADDGGSKNSILNKVSKQWKATKELWYSIPDKEHPEDEEYVFSHLPDTYPTECDILVIGGGVIGSSVAYWLKQRIFKELNVVVVERDPTYSKASTSLSVGGLRQQFSLEENIEMSLFGAEFLRNINDHLSVDANSVIDPYFHPYGYLTLATEKGAECLTDNSTLQNLKGAKNVLLTPEKLSRIFPWLNTEGIALGCLGLEKEGWFDPWSLLCAFKRKAMYLGAEYVHGEVKGFLNKSLNTNAVTTINQGVSKLDFNSVRVHTATGEKIDIRFSVAVIAAGAFSGEVGRMVIIGPEHEFAKDLIPVEPRKRFVYCFHCPDGPGLNTPLTIDPTGTYFRRDGLGGNFICGRSPSPDEEPSVDDLNVDHDYFEEKVWPVLAHRVKAFENLKVKSSWAGYYDYNTFDKNGIIGRHPIYKNLIFATGFSGHGIQQAPAVGRAVSELIIDNNYTTIDLSRLGFKRLIERTPLFEKNII